MQQLPTLSPPRPLNAVPPVLPPEWLQWVADCLMWEGEPASMRAVMQSAGLNPAACEAAIASIQMSPAFIAAQKHKQMQRKLESLMASHQKLLDSAPAYREIERRRGVSREELLERYVLGCRPVVLEDVAADWPALQRWSPADFATRFGHLEVDVQVGRSRDPLFEQNKGALRQRMRVGEFVDLVQSAGDSNDHYLTANDEMLRRPEFLPLLADIGSMPPLCDPSLLPGAASFWFGPGGTHTPLHHDTLMLFHTQIVGRKRWRFISPWQTPLLYNRMGVYSPIDLDRPDFERYPLFRQATVLETVLTPGDTLFLPLGWWHQVSALELSMSFSFTNLDIPNQFSYANPSIGNW